MVTDHCPNTYFMTQPNLSRRQARWSEYLQRFDFRWEYRAGRTNVADPLSRHPEFQPATATAIISHLASRGLLAPRHRPPMTREAQLSALRAKPGTTAPALAEAHQAYLSMVTRSRAKAPVQTPVPQAGPSVEPDPAPANAPATPPPSETVTSLKTAITQAYAQDPWCQSFPQEPQKYTLTAEGLWTLYKHQVVVPNLGDLRARVIAAHHGPAGAGHWGVTKTDELVKRSFWWPTLQRDVREFIKACELCQRNKPTNQAPAGLARPLDIPERRWDSISMDLITELPKTARGHDAIIVFVDRLSKMVHFAPTRTECRSR